MLPSDLPRLGDVIAGKYVVEDVLGAGGMGVVLAARHNVLQQRVAVKFLLPEATRLHDAPARFLREAQAAAALRSEHVARVVDMGTLPNGSPYLVMEYLEGIDLSQHLKARGALPLEEAVDYLLQAGEALAEAHSHGIVHRDLKPANLFLTRHAGGAPLVKVLDFGLSKTLLAEQAPSESSLTGADFVAGSPHYMSPEQVRSLKNVDTRTDIWALGVILHELLTGQRPFQGATPTAICAAVVADIPPPVRACRRDIPESVERAIEHCLQKNPAHRPQTVAELALKLAPFAPPRSAPCIEKAVRLAPHPVPQGALDALLPGRSSVVSVAEMRPPAAVAPPVGTPLSGAWSHQAPVFAGALPVFGGSAPVQAHSLGMPAPAGTTMSSTSRTMSGTARPARTVPIWVWLIPAVVLPAAGAVVAIPWWLLRQERPSEPAAAAEAPAPLSPAARSSGIEMPEVAPAAPVAPVLSATVHGRQTRRETAAMGLTEAVAGRRWKVESGSGRIRSRLWMGLLLTPLWVLAPSGEAHAQTKSSAPAGDTWRKLAEEGVSLYESGKFAEALERFEKAYALHPTPQAAVYKARCHVKLGQWLRARDTYARVLADKPAPDASANVKETYTTARTEHDALAARIPKIEVAVRGARGAVEVKIDGAVAAAGEQQVDPGRHTVQVASNGSVAEQTVEAIEGHVVRVELTLSRDVPASEPPAKKPSRGSLVPAIAAFGVGVAGLGIGAAMGAVAAGKSNEVERACPKNTCSEQAAPLLQDARTFAHVSTAGFVVGGAGAAAGVVLLIVRAKASAQAQVLGGRLDVGLGIVRWEHAF